MSSYDRVCRRRDCGIRDPLKEADIYHRAMPVSPYIKRIREAVGSDLILVPAVSSLVLDDDGRVLLVYELDQDAWSTPGGSVDVDERPEDAARREVLEETGFEIRLDGIITVLGGPEFRTHYKNGDEVAYVATVYRATVISGAARPDADEVTAVEWFTRDALGELPLSGFVTELFRFLGWV
jgi:ADP-ribose pyrophosphatase YjhB (NUDIX family)